MLKYSQAYLKLPFYIIKNYINHKRHRTVTLTINDVNIGRFDSFAIPLIIHNRIFPIHNVLYSYFNIERRTRIFLFLFLATHTYYQMGGSPNICGIYSQRSKITKGVIFPKSVASIVPTILLYEVHDLAEIITCRNNGIIVECSIKLPFWGTKVVVSLQISKARCRYYKTYNCGTLMW